MQGIFDHFGCYFGNDFWRHVVLNLFIGKTFTKLY